MDEVLLLDWGGTLASWSMSREETWRGVLEDLGVEAPPTEQIDSAIGEADRRLRPRLYDYRGRMDVFWTEHAGVVLRSLGLDPGLAARVWSVWLETEPERLRLYPEVPRVLELLGSRGHRLAIVSNNVDDLLRHVELLGVAEHFETITYSQEVAAAKPDTRIFRVALERMRCGPQEAVHVGNDLRADVEGARAAGISPILVDRLDRHLDADCMRLRDLRGLPDRVRRPGERAVAAHNLVHWLRRQLAQPIPSREHLEAAVANDDPAEVRQLLERFPFTEAQRRYVEELLDEWEREVS